MNFLIFTSSIFINYFLTRTYITKFGCSFISMPNDRSSHFKPTPNGGGICFAIISSLYSLFLGNNFLLLCLPLSIIGFIDDYINLRPFIRYIFQFLTVMSLLLFSGWLNLFFEKFSSLAIIFFIILILIIASTAVINFVNFMDGIDGLVASCMSIIFLTVCIKGGQNYLPILGTLIGFLILNWNPAKVFMGDSGSTFLGALYLSIIFKANFFIESLKYFLLLTPLIADSVSTLFRRLVAKQNIFVAHKKHLYQRLFQSGLSHKKVSLLYAGMTLAMCLIYLVADLKSLVLMAIILLILGFWLDKNVAYQFD